MVCSRALFLAICGVHITSALPVGFAAYQSIQQAFRSFSHKTPKGNPPEGGHSLISSTVSLVPEQVYESWIASERGIAFESILDNIGGYGEGLNDVMRGAVIASPSKKDPDYYYQVCPLI